MKYHVCISVRVKQKYAVLLPHFADTVRYPIAIQQAQYRPQEAQFSLF